MCSLPLQYGFAPKKWYKARKVMLEKDARTPRIDRLCVIHLFEGDYSCMLKLIWSKRLIKIAAQFCLLMPAQKVRQGHLTVSAVLNKVQTNNLIRLVNQCAASFDNGAGGCYDNIVPPTWYIMWAKVGNPKISRRNSHKSTE